MPSGFTHKMSFGFHISSLNIARIANAVTITHSKVTMFLVSDLLTFCFRCIFDSLLIDALLSQNVVFAIYGLFLQIFETGKQTPQTFSLLECMVVPKLLASRVEFKVWGEGLGSICGVKN